MLFPNHLQFPLQIVKNSKRKWHIVTKCLNIVYDLPKKRTLEILFKTWSFFTLKKRKKNHVIL